MSRLVSIYGNEDSSAGVRFSKTRKALSVIQRVLFGQAQRPQQRIEKAERCRQRPCLPVNRCRREEEPRAVAKPVSQSFPRPNMKENSLAQSARCRVGWSKFSRTSPARDLIVGCSSILRTIEPGNSAPYKSLAR